MVAASHCIVVDLRGLGRLGVLYDIRRIGNLNGVLQVSWLEEERVLSDWGLRAKHQREKWRCLLDFRGELSQARAGFSRPLRAGARFLGWMFSRGSIDGREGVKWHGRRIDRGSDLRGCWIES